MDGQAHALRDPRDGGGGADGDLENLKREVFQYPVEHPEKFLYIMMLLSKTIAIKCQVNRTSIIEM